MTDTAFDTRVRPEIDRLYRLAARLTQSRDDAEDPVQDTLIRAYEQRERLAGIEALGAWLSRVLYNRFIDNRREYERRRLRIVESAAAVEATPSGAPAAVREPSAEAVASRELDITALETALAGLSLEQRAVVLMHDAEGYKIEEIHQITGIEIGTLKSRLHRARRRLRKLLADAGTFSPR